MWVSFLKGKHMVLKVGLLMIGATVSMHGLLRQALENYERTRSGSIECAMRITPLSPLPRADKTRTPFDKAQLRYLIEHSIPLKKTSLKSFLKGIDTNDRKKICKYETKTFLHALHPHDTHCKQPPAIRALISGNLAAFEAIVDLDVESLTIPDEQMCTVDMHCYLYALKGKNEPYEILTERNIILARTFPVDTKKRNVLWHLVNMNMRSFEREKIEYIVWKIKALRAYGVSATARDIEGKSALDRAREIYGAQSQVVMALEESLATI